MYVATFEVTTRWYGAFRSTFIRWFGSDNVMIEPMIGLMSGPPIKMRYAIKAAPGDYFPLWQGRVMSAVCTSIEGTSIGTDAEVLVTFSRDETEVLAGKARNRRAA